MQRRRARLAGRVCVRRAGLHQLVVCEVKTRSSERFGAPAEAVDPKKAGRIKRVTQAWLAAHRVRWCDLRFDVVAVVAEPGAPARITHYRSAF